MEGSSDHGPCQSIIYPADSLHYCQICPPYCHILYQFFTVDRGFLVVEASGHGKKTLPDGSWFAHLAGSPWELDMAEMFLLPGRCFQRG